MSFFITFDVEMVTGPNKPDDNNSSVAFWKEYALNVLRGPSGSGWLFRYQSGIFLNYPLLIQEAFANKFNLCQLSLGRVNPVWLDFD